MGKHRNYLLLIIISAVVLAWVMLIANQKLNSGSYNALDLGIYTQVAWNSAHGNLFGFSIHPHSYLGDHLEFSFLLAVPFFKALPSPLTLIFLQALAICIGGFLLYKFAKRYLAENLALLWASIFLLNPLTLNALVFEFHALLLAVPFVFLSAIAYQNKNFKLFCFWMLLILLTREDLSLIVAGFALLALLEKHSPKWWLLPGIISAAWFLGATYITGQINGEGYKFLGYFNPGSSEVGLTSSMFSNLLKIFRPQNLAVLLSLLLPVLALPILKWRWLALIIFPFLGISIAGYGAGDIILQTHYVMFFLPGIFLAAVLGWQKLWITPPKFIQNLGEHARPLMLIIFISVSVYSLLTFGPTLSAVKTNKKISIADTTKAQYAANLAENTPSSQTVIAGYNTLVPFASRPQIYSFHYAFLGKRQYSNRPYPLSNDLNLIVIDSAEFITLQAQYAEREDRKAEYQSGYKRIGDLLVANKLKLAGIEDSLLIFSKEGNSNFQLYQVENAKTLDSGKPIQIKIPGAINLDETGYVEIPVAGQITKTTIDNYQLELKWFDNKNQNLETRILPLGYGLKPTSDWQTNEIITTNFRIIPPQKAAYAKIRSIIPKGAIVLNGWRAAEIVLDKNIESQSDELQLVLNKN